MLNKLLGAPVTGIINTALSLIKDKTKDKDQSFIQEKVANGVSLSSKRVLNLTGTGCLLMYGISHLDKDFNQGFGICALGVVYSVGMSLMSHLSEKK